MSTPDLKDRVVKSRVKLLKNSPFFGTLLLNAPWREDKEICPTACTDGATLMINPDFAEKLSDSEFQGVLLHEIMHMCLEHVDRLKDVFMVDPATANIAADIVVNGIIDDNKLTLPNGAVRDDKLKHLSVREIYNILKQKQAKNPNYLEDKYGVKVVNTCLVQPGGKDGKGQSEGDSEKEGEEKTDGDGGQQSQDKPNWKDILQSAATIAKMKKAGPVGAGLDRLFSELLQPSIDWRTLLYKYLTNYPTDFTGFDRRFTYRNLYLDDFSGTKLTANVYIDTSGSVDSKILTEFLSEVQGAALSTDFIEGHIFCFDTTLYHICKLEDLHPPTFVPKGGGGTSFHPIFKKASSDSFSPTLHIILTDGWANLDTLPAPGPSSSILWVISPGGVDSNLLPHGEVARIML
jgi:predicted metal-dependent peptidase